MHKRRLFELAVLNAAERFAAAGRGATAEKRRLERELVQAAEQLKRYRLHDSGAYYAPGADPDDVTGGNGDG
jgi:hypothetical protein